MAGLLPWLTESETLGGEPTMLDIESRTAVAPCLPNEDPVGSLTRPTEATEALLVVAPEVRAQIGQSHNGRKFLR